MAHLTYPEVDEALAALDSGDLTKVRGLLEQARDGKADPALREKAHELYGSDDVEVDDEAAVSRADDGTWVSAWVWVRDEEDAGEEDDESDEEEEE